MLIFKQFNRYLIVSLAIFAPLMIVPLTYGGRNSNGKREREESPKTQHKVTPKVQKKVRFVDTGQTAKHEEQQEEKELLDDTPDFLESHYSHQEAADFSGRCLGDEDLGCIAVRPSVEVLYLSENEITGEGLRYLGKLSNLRVLKLDGCYFIKDNLRYVGAFENLGGLYLNGCKDLTSQGLKHLARLRELKALYLAGCCNLVDSDFQCLKNFSHLSYLDLSSTLFTDEAMEYIVELTNLEYLDLEGTKVTNASIEKVKTLRNLKWVNLEKTSVTEKDVEELREYFQEHYSRHLIIRTDGFSLVYPG